MNSGCVIPAAIGMDTVLKIALTELSELAVSSIVESFVLREGTDYGERETDLRDKCAQVRAQLETGEAHIDFDPATGSVDIRTGMG